MTFNGWLQITVYLLAILAVTRPLGSFMTRVFARERTWLDPVLRPVERLIYRLTGVDEKHDMRWTEYAVALVLFSVVSMIVLYLMQRLQAALPFNPQALGAVAPDLAFNTAASFTTNTNWQSYVPETTMSYLTQMAGLAYHNFVVGGGRHRAGDRVHPRHRAAREGDARQLLGRPGPLLALGAAPLLLRRRAPARLPGGRAEPEAVRQSAARRSADDHATDADGKETKQIVSEQVIAQGPTASQEIIKEWGTNGGGFFNANSAHPFENPTPLSNFLEMFAIFAISAGLTYTLGQMTGSRAHGWAVWAAMAFLFLAGVTTAYWAEAAGNPMIKADQTVTALVARRQHGRQGNQVRHRELRPVRDGHDRCELRRGERLARLVHADRRDGAARQHHAGRGDLRRRRRGDVRHPHLRRPLGVHRRADGRPDAGVPRQEGRSVRRPDGDARGAHHAARHPGLHGDLGRLA